MCMEIFAVRGGLPVLRFLKPTRSHRATVPPSGISTEQMAMQMAEHLFNPVVEPPDLEARPQLFVDISQGPKRHQRGRRGLTGSFG